jgi:hypothetical protein
MGRDAAPGRRPQGRRIRAILASRTNAAITAEISAVNSVFPLILVSICAVGGLCAGAGARDLPMPRAKPDQAAKPDPGKTTAPPARSEPAVVPPAILAPPMEAFAADPEPAAKAAAPAEPSLCQRRIENEIAVIAPQPPLIGPGDCGATDVVRLQEIILKDKSRVAVTPPATLRCGMAEALATWVREDVTDAVAGIGASVRSLDNYASFDCRGRNRVAGAKISEHGMANAIDIRGFALSNGKFAGLTDRGIPRDFRDTVKKSICARFTTVLGPGSDGHHETHIHMDLAERRGGYRLCQWDVLEPVPDIPLPRPRPADAPQAGAE